jgi:class I fructose-bisphosphate aldolase
VDARTGKKIRLGRLFNANSHRTLIVAYSHGLILGPGPGLGTLDEIRQTASALRAADGLMISPGMITQLEDIFVGKDAPSLVVQIDWQSFSRSILPYQQGAAVAIASVEQIAATGADVVMSYLYVGFDDPEREKMDIARNAALARECERCGLLLMIEPRSAREKTIGSDKSDPAIMAMYARTSAELGADLVKVIDPGSHDALEQIAAGCPAPVVLAGGSKKGTLAEAEARARAALKAGWSGLVFGRNIYQQPDPAAALAAFRRIVHGES